jgi:WXG100 family type VII secretion target
MSTFKVTSTDLSALGNRVAQGSEETQTLLSNLAGQVEALTGVWDGQAASNFQGLYREWQQGASQVKEAMDGISQFLVQAAQTYEQTEAQIAQAAGSH